MRISVKLLTAGVVFFALLTAFFGCQKDEASVDTSSTATTTSFPTLQGVSVKNGMLVFNKQENFASAIDVILKNQENLGQLQRQFTGFVSYKQKYDEVMTQINKEGANVNDIVNQNTTIVQLVIDGKDNNVVPTIDAITLQYLANDKGLIQIGENIYKLTRDMTFEYLAVDFNKGVFKVIKQEPVSRSSKAIGEIGIRGETLSKTLVYQFDSRGFEQKRIIGEIAAVRTLLVSEVVVRTSNEKRSISGTWTLDANTNLTMTGTVSWSRRDSRGGICTAIRQININTSAFTNEIKQVLESKASVSNCPAFIDSPSNLIHTGKIPSGPLTGTIQRLINSK